MRKVLLQLLILCLAVSQVATAQHVKKGNHHSFEHKKNIGMLLLSIDLTSERELKEILPSDYEIFTTRVKFANPLNTENLKKVAEELKIGAHNLVPGYPLDLITFGCTSGAIAIGQETVEKNIQTSRSGVAVSNPAKALIKALDALKVNKISVVTPYSETLSQSVIEYIEAHGVKVQALHALGLESDIEIAKTPQEKIVQAVRETYKKDKNVDAIFISCTGLRTLSIIEDLEKELGIPVLTSNQVQAWDILRTTDYKLPILGYGKLLQMNLNDVIASE